MFLASEIKGKTPAFYEPFICLVGQGTKCCHVGECSLTYQPGDFFINFLPMPVTTEVVTASAEQPLLTAALSINLVRLAEMVLRIEQFDSAQPDCRPEQPTCLMIGKAEDQLVKLLEVGQNELDAQVLGDQVVDEIYYRMLTSEHGYALRMLLKQGMTANEASFKVGYNSFSQFSREYKRFFGFPPSQTRLSL